jgi:tRNA(His) guanylyltransferase
VAATLLGGECVLGYGQSDEFSFVLRRKTSLFGRRASKLASVAASTFAAAYARFWPDFFPGTPLQSTPAFDGRAVPYPSARNLRDYLSWRQADCHVNCQYNAAFWALVNTGGVSRAAAAAELKVSEKERKRSKERERSGGGFLRSATDLALTHLPSLASPRTHINRAP